MHYFPSVLALAPELALCLPWRSAVEQGTLSQQG